MDDKKLTALKGSIEKWRKIAYEGAVDNGFRDCPLCQLTMSPDGFPTCEGCPVMAATGLEGCDGTPYDNWTDHQSEQNGPFKVNDIRSKEIAIRELDFLMSLLPPSPQNGSN